MQPWMFNPNFKCVLCGRLHAMRQCTRFQVMTVEEKLRAVAHHGLCTNCLAQSHRRADCRTLDRCKQCMQDHNTWLHPVAPGFVWLKMSAQVRITPRPGEDTTKVRVLIDPNAARSSITLCDAKHLRCTIRQNRTLITLRHHTQPGWRLEVQCAVEDRDYGHHPVAQVYRAHPSVQVPAGQKADMLWCHRHRMSLILGADVCHKILCGPAVGRPGRLLRQPTKLGETYFGVAELVRAEDLRLP